MNDVTIYSKSIPKPPSKLKHMLTFILFILLLWGSSIQVDASFSKLVVGFPNIMDLLKEMVPPDWSYFQSYYNSNVRYNTYGDYWDDFRSDFSYSTCTVCGK